MKNFGGALQQKYPPRLRTDLEYKVEKPPPKSQNYFFGLELKINDPPPNPPPFHSVSRLPA